jgi:hypothetical protein
VNRTGAGLVQECVSHPARRTDGGTGLLGVGALLAFIGLFALAVLIQPGIQLGIRGRAHEPYSKTGLGAIAVALLIVGAVSLVRGVRARRRAATERLEARRHREMRRVGSGGRGGA